MVVFCCSVCGESLKKNQVQKHYSRCRMSMVSCMDCSHEFWDDDYQQHTKCISEEEKYSGKDFKPRPGQNKGEAKQDAWLHQVQQAIDNSNPAPKLRNLLERLKDYPNIPRKQAKFLNFIRNSLRADQRLANSVWEILMSSMPPKEDPKTKENNNNNNNNGDEKLKDNNNAEAVEEHGGVVEEGDLKKKSKRERKEERRKEQNKEEKKDLKKQQKISPEDEMNNNGECDRPAKKKGKKRKRNEDDLSEEDAIGNNGEVEVKKMKKKKKKLQVQINDDDDDGLPPLEPNPNHAWPEKTEMDDSDEENNVCNGKNGLKAKKNKSHKMKLQRPAEPLEPYPNVAYLEEEEEDKDSLPKKKNPQKNKFSWEQTILALLRKSKENSMSEKKLRKKVLAEYMEQDGRIDSMSILKAKFDRKIKKSQQWSQKKDKICLLDA